MSPLPVSVNEKLKQRGIVLPLPAKSVGTYVSAVRAGELVFTSGQLPFKEGELIATGKVPSEVSLEQARQSALQALLNALSSVQDLTGSIEAVRRIVRMTVYVNSSEGFTDQSSVADDPSRLLNELFDQAGQHTRLAVGAAELPLNAPVELELIVQVD